MGSFSSHDSNLVPQEEQHGGGPHSGAGGGRAERLAEELDDMERRVEQVIVEHSPFEITRQALVGKCSILENY